MSDALKAAKNAMKGANAFSRETTYHLRDSNSAGVLIAANGIDLIIANLTFLAENVEVLVDEHGFSDAVIKASQNLIRDMDKLANQSAKALKTIEGEIG